MRLQAARHTPVRFAFEAEESRQEGWGRFERLHPMGGRVVTRFRLETGDRVFLAFEAAGERFENMAARVERGSLDEDGYRVAELRITDEVGARRLGAALRGLMARGGA